MRVLAADDEDAMIKVLGRCLHKWGYEVVTAHDGIEAWRILKREDSPRIVILDWDMPGLSGVEVCRMLRSAPHGEDAYVLMLTARSEKTDLIEALEIGADDFLTKPFDVRELQLRLAKGVSSLEGRLNARRASGAPPSGTTLGGGKYRLEKKIAEGGMATVWLGVHLSLGINVAIKFMKPELPESAEYASFEREARAAAQLRSEHTVRVYDHGMTHDGSPYLVMEYLAGESLWERIGRSGPLPPDEVVAIVGQVARALSEAHGRGVIHRDVKPENILLVEDAEQAHGFTAKLIDFGLAKPAAAPNESDATTLVAGTPSYMSPEHLRATAPPNTALDLWGLAATAFAAMTGSVAFDGPSLPDIYRAVCREPPPIPSTVHPGAPAGFDTWFARACAKDPSARFETASELAAALAAACAASAATPETGPAVAKVTSGFARTEPDSASTRTVGERLR